MSHFCNNYSDLLKELNKNKFLTSKNQSFFWSCPSVLQEKSGEDDDASEDEPSLGHTLSSDEQTTISFFSRFANIMLNGPVCAETINPIVDFIVNANLVKNNEDKDNGLVDLLVERKDEERSIDLINLFIDTEGGVLDSALKLIDTIRMSEIPVRTIGWGRVASAGLIIFMTGKERFLSENCSILSHNATFSASSYSVRVNDFSHQQEFKLINERIMRIYKECTGKDERYIRKNLLRDNDVYMSARDAIKHGLGDALIPKGMSWLKSLVFTTDGSLDTKEQMS
jgi:ATP-dependent protease ClpP protease subunit